MENFTPLTALIGGGLIGLSAVLLMLLNGRIAGISGIFSGAFLSAGAERSWRLAFVLGLIGAPILYKNVFSQSVSFDMEASLPLILIGGFLVGFGTKLGSGCTSGHGVCGLSRLSSRSLVATLSFMAVGMITVALAKSFLGGA